MQIKNISHDEIDSIAFAPDLIGVRRFIVMAIALAHGNMDTDPMMKIISDDLGYQFESGAGAIEVKYAMMIDNSNEYILQNCFEKLNKYKQEND